MLFEEAEKIRWIGGEGYAFGTWTAAGALAAVLCMIFHSRRKGLKPGSGILMSLMSLVMGILCSRLFFCLLTQELGYMLPVSGWIRANGGGWSTTGMIGGVLLAGWITARCTRQRPADLLDTGCLALPLFMISERLGEQTTVDFDISRVISEETEGGGWLKVQDVYGTYLAVFRIAAILACALFIVLEIISRMKQAESGDVFNVFLLLFGALGILTESLRYDEFLSYHFVKFQQVGAALLLGGGLLAAALRCGRVSKRMKIASAVCLTLMVGIVIGLEFALDRTRTDPVLVYCGMILTVGVPTVIGLLEIRTERKG